MAKATGGYIQQLPSGSFRVSVYAGTDPLTGRQIRLRKSCKTERAAQIELGKLLEPVWDTRGGRVAALGPGDERCRTCRWRPCSTPWRFWPTRDLSWCARAGARS
jgi:hypothetical protein